MLRSTIINNTATVRRYDTNVKLAVITLIGFYFILPRAKAIFFALICLTGATGQNEFYD
tara:strand:+ start:119 stop:295 length:177 start_codon:yes stop_codon:yes gene_type:complete